MTLPAYYLKADKSAWQRRGRPDIPLSDDPPTTAPKFAGHIPNRVLIGMNAPEDGGSGPPRPKYTEAMSIIGGSVYVRRVYDTSSDGWSSSVATNLVAQPDSLGQLPVLSFKTGSTSNWSSVLTGSYDAKWANLRTWLAARRATGKPVCIAFHHEPDGDGPSGDVLADLALWGQVNEYLLDQVAGWRTGTYNAAEDFTDICAWTLIPNGNWWGLRFPKPEKIAAALPASLLTKMRAYGGPIFGDFYDANPPNSSSPTPTLAERNNCVTETSLGYAANADRTSRQMLGFTQWARANAVKAIGCGEFGCVTPQEFGRVWDLLKVNRDIWTIALHFNNFANSRWDWRMIPDGYPAYNGTNSKSLVDQGGDALSASYITAFQAVRDASVSPTYTS